MYVKNSRLNVSMQVCRYVNYLQDDNKQIKN